MQLDQEFMEVFIGLWKFRRYGHKPCYCVTFNVGGYYYDTNPYPTPQEAMRAGCQQWRNITKLPALPEHDEAKSLADAQIGVFKHTGKV